MMAFRRWVAAVTGVAALAVVTACGGAESDVGQACGTPELGYCTEDVTYCVDCAQLGPPDTCQVYGDADRYAGIDLGPDGRLCDEASPCPAPYECTAAPGHSEFTSCLLPCHGRDCPEGFFCDGVDIGAFDDAVPCGFCHPEDI